MSSKTYEQKVARLVQEAACVKYMTALRWVDEHMAAHPDKMTREERALAIVETRAPPPTPPPARGPAGGSSSTKGSGA